MTLRLPSPCLVVLAGPSASGKSAWAEANFEPGQVVSSDELRLLVGGPPTTRAARPTPSPSSTRCWRPAPGGG